ncbi:MAG TPA: SAM-dependent chlorinase/fluorinase [Solirubrobacteraceae bacterium]|nr:SAM-dependent chlorinase/fluorinase [Solirubrobacteraceae bacterium]
MPGPPTLTFLSDYGLQDEFVGVCHGVIARRCPAAHVIDITHAIPRHDVRGGALALAAALPYVPAGVHLAVVDPEVGAAGRHARRAVAVQPAAAGQLLVGPDNGLLSLALQQLGGAVAAVEIGRSPERLEPVSATFHGRDIFAPVAAALAAGAPLAGVGEPLPVEELRTLVLPHAELDGVGLRMHVLHVDGFGNVTLDADHELLTRAGLRLGEALTLEVAGGTHRARYVSTFADLAPGELLLYEDARRAAALAVNRGSAAAALGLERDDELLARPAP